MRYMICVAALVAVLCVTGCAGFVKAPVVPPLAFVYTSIKAPIDIDVSGTSMLTKKGESSTINVLGLVAVGDASVKAAADDGELVRVDHLDYEFLNVLGVFSKFTVIAYGQ